MIPAKSPHVEQILRLATNEVSPREIAAQLGINKNTINNIIYRARASGVDIPKRRLMGRPIGKGRILHVPLDKTVKEALATQADEHGMLASAFASKLLSFVVEDNLYDAIIDTESDDD